MSRTEEADKASARCCAANACLATSAGFASGEAPEGVSGESGRTVTSGPRQDTLCQCWLVGGEPVPDEWSSVESGAVRLDLLRVIDGTVEEEQLRAGILEEGPHGGEGRCLETMVDRPAVTSEEPDLTKVEKPGRDAFTPDRHEGRPSDVRLADSPRSADEDGVPCVALVPAALLDLLPSPGAASGWESDCCRDDSARDLGWCRTVTHNDHRVLQGRPLERPGLLEGVRPLLVGRTPCVQPTLELQLVDREAHHGQPERLQEVAVQRHQVRVQDPRDHQRLSATALVLTGHRRQHASR